MPKLPTPGQLKTKLTKLLCFFEECGSKGFCYIFFKITVSGHKEIAGIIGNFG